PLTYLISCFRYPLVLHSFPTRRSSDLLPVFIFFLLVFHYMYVCVSLRTIHNCDLLLLMYYFDENSLVLPFQKARFSYYSSMVDLDRKSTRLNSSHVKNSYAVFCLKKKK